MPKWGPFKGLLAAPVVYDGARPEDIMLTDDQEEFFSRETELRIEALYDHYKIERGNSEELIYSMAWDLVPGFGQSFKGDKNRGGRKANFTHQNEAQLSRDINLIVDSAANSVPSNHISRERACERLAKDGSWPPPKGVSLDIHINRLIKADSNHRRRMGFKRPRGRPPKKK